MTTNTDSTRQSSTTDITEIGQELWSYLTDEGATIEYSFTDMSVEVPKTTGQDAQRATWKLNGTVRSPSPPAPPAQQQPHRSAGGRSAAHQATAPAQDRAPVGVAARPPPRRPQLSRPTEEQHLDFVELSALVPGDRRFAPEEHRHPIIFCNDLSGLLHHALFLDRLARLLARGLPP
jgi:hypothetical protein